MAWKKLQCSHFLVSSDFQRRKLKRHLVKLLKQNTLLHLTKLKYKKKSMNYHYVNNRFRFWLLTPTRSPWSPKNKNRSTTLGLKAQVEPQSRHWLSLSRKEDCVMILCGCGLSWLCAQSVALRRKCPIAHRCITVLWLKGENLFVCFFACNNSSWFIILAVLFFSPSSG